MTKIKITITTPRPVDVEVTERILKPETEDEQLMEEEDAALDV